MAVCESPLYFVELACRRWCRRLIAKAAVYQAAGRYQPDVPIRRAMAPHGPVTVLLARFEDLVGAGLSSLIGADANLRIVAADIAADRLDAAVIEHDPRVAIFNLVGCSAPATLTPARRASVHAAARHCAGPYPPPSAASAGARRDRCLGRDVESRDVLTTIHLASRGLHVLPRSATAAPGHELLTPREADVLGLLPLGHSNGEIAAELSVCIETVRTHARSVFRKLGVRSRRELSNLSRSSAAGAVPERISAPRVTRQAAQEQAASSRPVTSHSRQSDRLTVCRRLPRYVTTRQNGAMPIAVVQA